MSDSTTTDEVQTMTEAQAEMPKYQCHKVVHALKLHTWKVNGDGSATLFPEDEKFSTIRTQADWARKIQPKDDDPGYYVVYEDGYTSWSPTKAFEDGYTRI